MPYSHPSVVDDLPKPVSTNNTSPKTPPTFGAELRRSPGSYSLKSGETTYVNRNPAVREKTHATYSRSPGEKTVLGQRPRRQPSGPYPLPLGAIPPMNFPLLMSPSDARQWLSGVPSHKHTSSTSLLSLVHCYAQVVLLDDSLRPWTSVGTFEIKKIEFVKLAARLLKETSTTSIHNKVPFKEKFQVFLNVMAQENVILISSLARILRDYFDDFQLEGLRRYQLFLPDLGTQSAEDVGPLKTKNSIETQPLLHSLSHDPEAVAHIQLRTKNLVDKMSTLIETARMRQRDTHFKKLEGPIETMLGIKEARDFHRLEETHKTAIETARELLAWDCLPKIVPVNDAVVSGVNILV